MKVEDIHDYTMFLMEELGMGDWRTTITFRTDADDSIAECDAEPEYKKVTFAFNVEKMVAQGPAGMRAVVQHEVFHALISPYTRIAKAVTSEEVGNGLHITEESLATAFEEVPFWPRLYKAFRRSR